MYKLDELGNKFRVLHLPRETSLSVTVMVLVRVGSRYENKKDSGIAHFVEHMFFKGTEIRPTSKDIGNAIEMIGGSSNAFTSYDYTGYYIKVPKEKFAEATEILSDMIKNGTFDQSEIDKERGVIIEEIKMYEDRPMSKVGSIWSTEFFGDTPLGRDIAGTEESVSQLNKEDFIDFVGKNYVGNDMLFVAAGGVDSAEVVDVAKKHFSELNEGKVRAFDNYSRDEKESKVINLQKPLEQSHLMIGGYSYNRGYENKFILKVAQAMLSQGFSSRLFQVIRDQLGLAYYVYSRTQSFEDIGVFNIGLGVENSKVELAVEAVMKELTSLINGDFDDQELLRAKNYMLGNLVTDLENSDDLGLWYGLQKLLSDDIHTVEEVKNKIQKVTRDQIIDELQKVLKGQNLLLAGVTPHESLSNNIKDHLVL